MSNKSDKTEENINSLLPFGEAIKPLITSSSLSDNDLRFVLQKRGVFVITPQKNISIPILSSLLLSPKEFDILRNRQHIKESNIKTSTAQSECLKPEVELISLIDEELILSILRKNESEFNPIQTSKQNILHQRDCIIIEGTSIRKDWTRDIFSYETEHSWKLQINKKQGSNIIQYKSETTIPETKTFILELQKAIYSALKAKGIVSNEGTIQRVLAAHFLKYEGIFEYLLAFTQLDFESLVFKRISNINCGINNKGLFPKNFEWLKENVEEIALQGKKLEASDVIELGKKGILIFGEIDADYSFDFNNVKGDCTIRYGFPNYFQKLNQIEFEAKVQTIELKKEFAHFPRETAKRLISDHFLQNKHELFQDFINRNLADTSPKTKDRQLLLLSETNDIKIKED